MIRVAAERTSGSGRVRVDVLAAEALGTGIAWLVTWACKGQRAPVAVVFGTAFMCACKVTCLPASMHLRGRWLSALMKTMTTAVQQAEQAARLTARRIVAKSR